MNKILLMILIVTFIVSIQSLHFVDNHKQQEQALDNIKQKQSDLDDKIGKMITTIIKVQSQLSTSNKGQRIYTLSKAVLSSRDQNSKTLLQSFNMSKESCKEIQNDKYQFNSQIDSAKTTIKNIRELAATLPNEKITSIIDDIDKEQVFVINLQKVISQCQYQAQLSPTIFQTNVYAKSWILGSLTFDQLINQYYQRSIQFENVNNCPLSNPFFNGKRCMQCPNSSPVFNIETKKCTKCDEETDIDNQLKKCIEKPHYTLYNDNLNYALDGANQLPKPLPNGSPCKKAMPFYNGKKCQKCQLPKYWSVGGNQCKQCPTQQLYDINTHNCGLFTPNQLTILDDSDWVVNDKNPGRVYTQRDKILRYNQTQKKYVYCPSMKPYYDGIQCIFCKDQFNIDDNRCTSAPQGMVYSRNLRRYVTLQVNKQSNSKARDYLAKQPLVDTSIPDCDISTPYYDGISCLKCPAPKLIFNVDTKRCGNCPNQTYFNQNGHSCSDRPIVYISKKYEPVLPTKKVSLEDYKKQVADKIKSNPQAMIKQCKDTQFSNFISCFSCSPKQYFNLETKNCDNMTYVTNIKGDKFLQSGDSTYEKFVQSVLKIKQTQTYKECPQQTPYSKGSQCIACNDNTPLFNLESKSCTKCPDNKKYLQNIKQCMGIKYLTDLTSQKLIQTDTYTLETLKIQQQKFKSNSVTVQCSDPKPFSNEKQCIGCNEETKPYFNIRTQQCQGCQQGRKYSPENRECFKEIKVTNVDQIKNYIETEDYKLKNLKQQIQKQKKQGFIEVCPTETPLFDGSTCITCKQASYFNLKTKKCQTCQEGFTYVESYHSCIFKKPITNIENVGPYIQTDNYKLSNVKTQNEAIPEQKKYLCPSDTPFSNGKSCIKCDKDLPNFNLQTKQCTKCDQGLTYVQKLHSCLHIIPITNIQKAGAYIQTDKTKIDNVKSQNDAISEQKKSLCPQDTPFSNGKKCLNCDNDLPYFNLQTKQCVKCDQGLTYIQTLHVCLRKKPVTNFQAAGLYIQTENTKMEKIKKQSDAISSQEKYNCPQNTPFSNGKACIKCKKDQPYFNLQTKLCVKCDQGLTYVQKQHNCLQITPITNVQKAEAYIQTDKYKMDNLKKQNDAIPQQKKSLCPQDTPFSNGKSCIKCEKELPYFNLQTKQCVKCDQGLTYIEKLHFCLLKKPITNIQKAGPYLQTDTYKLDNIKKQNDAIAQQVKYVCPQETPFSDGKKCLKCEQDLPYFNLQTKKCQNCPQKQSYIQKLHICLKKIPVTNIQSADSYIQTDNYSMKDVKAEIQAIAQQKKQTCPAQTPFSTGKKCIKCEDDLPYFNLQTKQCTKCSQSEIYDKTSKKCKALKTVTNVDSAKEYLQTQNVNLQKLKQQIEAIPKNLKKVCPQQKPFSDGKDCIKCQSQSYFNLQTKKCENCPDGTIYNQAEFICKKLKPQYPQLSNLKWIVSDENPQKILDLRNQLAKVPDAQECPASAPHYNKSKKICVSCPQKTYFNYDTIKCQSCDPKVFDQNVRSCLQKVTGKYQTLLTRPNLVRGGYSKNQYEDQYAQNKQKYPQMQDCPQAKPYFDSINCIKCPSKLPYFNLRYNLCQVCEAGSTYDQKTSECRNTRNQSVNSAPNIAKMYANIF